MIAAALIRRNRSYSIAMRRKEEITVDILNVAAIVIAGLLVGSEVSIVGFVPLRPLAEEFGFDSLPPPKGGPRFRRVSLFD